MNTAFRASQEHHEVDVPEHEVIQRPCNVLRQNGHHNPVGPHNQVSQSFSQEGVQPQAHCLGSVGAAEGFAKVQFELDLRWFPASRLDIMRPDAQSVLATAHHMQMRLDWADVMSQNTQFDSCTVRCSACKLAGECFTAGSS